MTSPPHRRLNLLTGEWVLVSPQRMDRPWQGQVEPAASTAQASYDAGCYLCPRNQRAHGTRNPDYQQTYVFTNDFPAVLPDAAAPDKAGELLHAEGIRGTCRVICFSPRHDLTLAELSAPELRVVIDAWAAQTSELGERYRWVQVFENKGELMGCSNPHPHGQIWALDELPTEAQKEAAQQLQYHERTGRVLLLDYTQEEIARSERVVVDNEHWLAVVPFWATWPFEILLLPRHHVLRLPDLSAEQRAALATIMQQVLVRYDNLFATSFPYSMGWHGAPYGAGEHGYWQLHAHFYPPLLRSATVRKFMVGFEMLGEAQRDLTPEQAAAQLRALSDVHYRTKRGS